MRARDFIRLARARERAGDARLNLSILILVHVLGIIMEKMLLGTAEACSRCVSLTPPGMSLRVSIHNNATASHPFFDVFFNSFSQKCGQ